MNLPPSFSVGAVPALTQDAIRRIQGVDLSKADLSVPGSPQTGAALKEAVQLTSSTLASSDFYSPKRIFTEVTSVDRKLGPLQTPTTAGQLVATDPLPQAPTPNQILSIATSTFDTINNPAFGTGFLTNFTPEALAPFVPAIPNIGANTQPLQAIAAITLAPIGNPTSSPLLANFVPAINPALLPSGTVPAGATVPQSGQVPPLTQDPTATMRQLDINPALLGSTAGSTSFVPISSLPAGIDPARVGQVQGTSTSVPTAFVVTSSGALQPVSLSGGVSSGQIGQVSGTGTLVNNPFVFSSTNIATPTAFGGLPVTAANTSLGGVSSPLLSGVSGSGLSTNAVLGTDNSAINALPLFGTNGLLANNFASGNFQGNPVIGLRPATIVPQVNPFPVGASPTATTVLASITNFIDQLLFRQPTFQPPAGSFVTQSPFGGITILNPQEPQSAGTTLAYPQPFDTTFAQTGPLTPAFNPFAKVTGVSVVQSVPGSNTVVVNSAGVPTTSGAFPLTDGSQQAAQPYFINTNGQLVPLNLLNQSFTTPVSVQPVAVLNSPSVTTSTTAPVNLLGLPINGAGQTGTVVNSPSATTNTTIPVNLLGLPINGAGQTGTVVNSPSATTNTTAPVNLLGLPLDGSDQTGTIGQPTFLTGQSLATVNNPIAARTGTLTFGTPLAF